VYSLAGLIEALLVASARQYKETIFHDWKPVILARDIEVDDVFQGVVFFNNVIHVIQEDMERLQYVPATTRVRLIHTCTFVAP
jgi:hypothetical protein